MSKEDKKIDNLDSVKENENNEKTKEVFNIEEVDDVSLEEDTKEVVKIEDVEKEIEEETSIKEEKEVQVAKEKLKVEKDNTLDESFVEKKNNTKNIIAIILICIILILFIFLIYVLNEDRKEKENNKKLDKDITDIVLSEDEKKDIVNSYGDALESAILIHYQKFQVLLDFNEATKLVELENDVVCREHEIYEDGKVYLTNCFVNGKKTKYSYGEKQEPKEHFDSGTMIKVYHNKTTGQNTLNMPNSLDNIEEYTVHCNESFDSPTILEGTDYVFYFDKEYNVKMMNFKTDKRALENVNYTRISPFMIEDRYYDSYYVAVYNGSKWGVYDLRNEKPIIGYIYDYITTLSTGVSGPSLCINTLKERTVAVYKNGKYGVIDYSSGVEIIPVEYELLMRSGNYLWATHNGETDGVIYDFSGNTYLTSGYEKVYGIAGGTYVLVKHEGEVKLIQIDGKVLYNYGEVENLGRLNFAFEYNKSPIFQFYKDDPTELSKCVEYTYDSSTKKGEHKDIFCGGIAKPILYLYPEEKMNVTVSFSNPEILETTYPKFNGYWNVKAAPNGDLVDMDNKYYYALYWDEKKVHKVDFSEGYYVEKDNAIEFLEEKLSYIGLSDRERNEFIMYWLPILEKNEKSLVYFELTEERESYNKLLINPQPDSMLRVVIHIKKVDDKVNIKKQSLKKFNRKGFSVVEWGGTTY